MTVERAEEVMVEADAFGLALVIVVTQEKAEEYCEKLRGNGAKGKRRCPCTS